MSDDKKSIDDVAKKETDRYVRAVCKEGITDPLKNKPLWQSHPYTKPYDWINDYCMQHKEIYDKIIARQKLDGLDGQ